MVPQSVLKQFKKMWKRLPHKYDIEIALYSTYMVGEDETETVVVTSAIVRREAGGEYDIEDETIEVKKA